MRVLIAEDDPHMRAGIVEILSAEGYEVEAVADGPSAVDSYERAAPDFVLLDIMMPGLNGYDVCRRIRARNQEVPIVFLSAKSEEVDKVLGLELGADDYVMKPFGVKELIARVRAVARRAMRTSGHAAAQAFTLVDLTVYPSELRARRDDATIELSLREVKLLQFFFEHPHEALDRDRLFEAGWGHEIYPNTRTLDQHVSKLRKKVERDVKAPRIIRTVHGVGYRYDP